MEKVIQIFNKIQATNSKNEKQAIITDNADNELFKKCLVFLLDGNIVTGISKKKLSKTLVVTDQLYISVLQTWEECMKYLHVHNTGTDVDIREMQIFITNQPEDHREFYQQMIVKSLRLGCDDKTVNKAIPGLISTWEVQHGSSYEKLKLKKGETFYLSQKLNGNRCSFFGNKLMSRQGKEFTGMQHILNDIYNLEMSGYFIDGELVRKNIDNLPDGENFRIGTGIINSDTNIKREIKLVIFDIFPAIYLDKKESLHTYKHRKYELEKVRENIAQLHLENVEVVTMVYEGTDQTQIMKWLDYAVDNGWEGLMLNKDTTYKCKRTTDLIKIKRFYSMDLPIIEVVEGDGRLKETLGALVVQYKENTVNVGSGFDDKTRKRFWNMKDKLIGRIIEIKYKEITSDKKTGLESLQFPIFQGLREYGKEVSYD